MNAAGERYLGEVDALLTGPRDARRRLLDELRGHVADAVAAGVPEDEAVAAHGAPGSVAAAWHARCDRQAARLRRRVGACVLGLAAASVLAVAQHAAGGRPLPAHPTPAWVVSKPAGQEAVAPRPAPCVGQRQLDGR
jgi:hypothetical protein